MIIIKSAGEIEAMREAGRVAAVALSAARAAAGVGVTTADVDEAAEAAIRAEGAIPAFKGYGGFPATICASVNDQVVHGIPSKRVRLASGDIFTIDVGAIVDGFYGDNADTVAIGQIDARSRLLIDTTREALYAGIEQCVVGNRLGDVSSAIEAVAVRQGLGIVREYVGHGIGRAMHEDPNVPNYGRSGAGPVLQAGMVIAIEPMLNLGGDAVRLMNDGWTVVTADRSRSAQIEHTVAITDAGPRILTLE